MIWYVNVLNLVTLFLLLTPFLYCHFLSPGGTIIALNRTDARQSIIGFGGAFTDSTALNVYTLTDPVVDQFVKWEISAVCVWNHLCTYFCTRLITLNVWSTASTLFQFFILFLCRASKALKDSLDLWPWCIIFLHLTSFASSPQYFSSSHLASYVHSFPLPFLFQSPSDTSLSHISSPSAHTSVRMASSTTCVAFPSLVVTAPPDLTHMMMWKAILILSTGHWNLKILIIRWASAVKQLQY